MKYPTGYGCAPAPTPPPRLWCWMPVNPLTCLTASTPVTPMSSVLPVFLVGLDLVTLFICVGLGVWFYSVIHDYLVTEFGL